MDNTYIKTAKNQFNFEDKRIVRNQHNPLQNRLPHLIRKSLEKKFGERATVTIIEYGCRLFGEPESKILSNYILFSKMIGIIFGKFGKERIIHHVEEDLKKQGLL